MAQRPNTRMQSDRFAREIVAFLARSDAARLRRLMRNPLGGPQAILLGLGSGGLASRNRVPGRARHARRCPINHLPHHPAPRPPTSAPRGQTTSLLLRLPSRNCVPPNTRIQPTPFRRPRSPLFHVLYLI